MTVLPRLVWGSGDDIVHSVEAARPLWRLVIPVGGALLAGLILILGERWWKTSRGWDILEAVVLRDGELPVKPTVVKAASSVVTVSSGGPVGREGTIVLAAATVGSVLGGRLGLPVRHRRILTGCGIAAGLACAYNTPVGAALFTVEILFGSFALETFAPLVLASIVATLLTRATFGDVPVFPVPALAMASAWEILPCALLGALAGAAAALFLAALGRSAALFRRLKLPRPLAMAAAAIVLGIAIQRFPELVGNGREGIAAVLQENLSLGRVAALLALRLLVTPLAVGSGAVGGVFTPTLFLGAMLGDAFGAVAHGALPGVISAPSSYALVGMGALLAGTTHAPLTAALMVFEMTLDYRLVVPLLLASAMASIVATALAKESVYTEALKEKAAAGERGLVTSTLSVGDVLRREQVTVTPDLTLPDLLDRFVANRRNHVYVVDADDRFRGAVNLHDVNRLLGEGTSSARASDVAREDFEATYPSEPLHRVLERFAKQDAERLPVLDAPETRRLIGTVSKRDILGVYSRDLLQRGTNLKAAHLEAPVDRLVDEIPVPPELVGLSVGEARFPERYGATLLMVRRARSSWLIPDAATRLLAEDRLIVFGPQERLAALRRPAAGRPS
ncbi:MAG TPA: chloride channel protein [Thermoanaerobaculia bacterium]|nr:chloride channel protein [Thermoanaerobaculia bacterium]